MKSAPYLAVLTLMILSSCSSAYKTTQTPDDVYYSPRVKPTYASSNNNNRDDNVSYTDSEDGGTYVNYDDDQGDYARRLSLFNNSYSGGFYDYYGTPGVYSSMYANPYYGYGYGSSFSLGFGYGYPYYGSAFSLGFGFGYPYYGGFYDPWYYPYYGYGYGYGYPYYGGYYGGGYYGHGGYYTGYRRTTRNTAFSSGSTGGRMVGGSGSTGGRTRNTDFRPSRVG